MNYKMYHFRYGNTSTYFLNGLLLDTDMAGTIGGLFKELKKHNLQLCDIKYVLATHYHPDHMGLISELNLNGVKPLLIDCQKDFVHYSDQIFLRQKNFNYQPIDETNAVVIKCSESRKFLSEIGIRGEIIQTLSHSADGIALITDDGNCFVGDLEPMSFADGYENNVQLKNDWKKIMRYNPKKIFYAHRIAESYENEIRK